MVVLQNIIFKTVVVMWLGFWLTACAFSPQQIRIAPPLNIHTDNVGAGISFRLGVKDVREDPVLGYRGGVYRESSTIEAVDLEKGLGDSLSKAMQGLGYAPVVAGALEVLRIEVFVDELNYGSPDVLYSNKVDMAAQIRVEVYRGKHKFKNSYSTRSERRFSIAPNQRDNQKLINELLASTMSRIFNDASFLAFIS